MKYEDTIPVLSDKDLNYSVMQNITVYRTPCKYEGEGQCYYSDKHLLDEIYAFLKPQIHEWFFTVLYIIVFIFGLTGNSLVCFVVWRTLRLRTTTNLFLVNLAVADLLVLILCLPPSYAQTIWETWFLGNVMCKVVEWYQSVSVVVSVLTLTSISIERWLAICHSVKFQENRNHVVIAIIIIWIIGHVASIPRLIIFSVTTDSLIPDNLTILMSACTPYEHRQAALVNEIVCLTLFFLLPITIMGFTYLSVAFSLWSSIKDGEFLNERSCQNMSYQLQARRRIAKMLIVVVICFILCFLPGYVWNILRLTNHPIIDVTPSAVGLTVHLLIYINSSINPLIYNFMSYTPDHN
ncbi:hypothetical protein LOTGIDRAFT_162575 [Lottia gigantea]|uniref:G-protein coupled receptors family 1 profile domain-containing protein n=1 Tax=Lottia gigantea TaxID=225164 RepID=V4BUC5_LOTGI|nr:hypothetical protein LOTGIDRAFT_162575 [Lottia gigantea]ESO92654.1 hypothetical protein LOTGIDRAFT_162575 [Lottia gigantea]